ncbi:hypothetical protein PGT21_007801 [Puccinia graminis f. sp. tritici]|uniref:SAC domain-containing protein n=1 Tax=Puccinia graminis f. sp. tritici TaxID=56615 RepID=A0A5B0M4N4_PUCGR|nr:hypothetical protein PGT21_007801 [Puccinia graminis f. sp. tritici]KAA1123079.1 hypothetical protein PGTUg99_000837 [Puccinia graminis f. sp. tritici]
MNSEPTRFSLPTQITIYISHRALFIKPHHHPKSLTRLEWSQQPTLALIQDQKTIEDELSLAESLKIQLDGLIGLIQLFQDTYLIAIASHSVVARFEEKELRRIERVLAIPLVYQKAHELVKNELNSNRPRITQTLSTSTSNNSITTANTSNDDLSSQTDELPPEADEDLPPGAPPSASSSPSLSSSVEEGFQKIVEPNKINFSRLLWKPKPILSGHQEPSSSSTSTSTAENIQPPQSTRSTRSTSTSKAAEEAPLANQEGRLSLDKKFVAVLSDELTRGGMFYALDWDITHSFQSKADQCSPDETEPRIAEPLHKRAQSRFWWNQRLIQPFIKSGFDNLGYVIMQGFVESTQVKILKLKGDERADAIPQPSSESPKGEEADDGEEEEDRGAQKEVDLVEIEIGLISRRSVLRPGLRYQRRGIDGAGSVANAVETECVITTRADPSKSQQSVFWSFVQIRGSVPLFWSQNPAGLRPPIVLEGDPIENLDAMKKHFADLIDLYGRILVICLAERSGNEARLVAEFERQVGLLEGSAFPSDPPGKVQSTLQEKEKEWVKFVSWDFHQQCKGMHYENVLDLVEQIDDDISQFGYFSRTGDRQKGVIRSNCIDCLDRTNVIQSAIAKQVLNRFLRHLNLPINPDLAHDQLDVAFNSLWANNGDQISKQYAGTSALKGDFVRTGRRNWRGIVNDATNSMARMWHNSISDFFKQRVLDYTLGVNVTTFSQFQQAYSSIDPNDLSRFAKFRSLAIDDAAKQVLSEGESKLDGWNLLTPSEETSAHSVKAVPLGLEERIIILSSKALYIVSYEYVLSKVQEFLRIGLEDIVSLQLGVYITSVADERDREEQENYGFVISYDTVGATEKKKTYSMRMEGKKSSPTALEGGMDDSVSVIGEPESATSRSIKQVAFKAPKDLTSDSFPSTMMTHDCQPKKEEDRPSGRLSAEGFIGQLIKRVERECNRNQIIFIDEARGTGDREGDPAGQATDEHLEDEETERLRRLVVLERCPIISLDDYHASVGSLPSLPFNLFARMSRGVKQIIG